MCGIVGWIDAAGVDPDLLSPALERLASRGPDGQGRWIGSGRRVVLGHRRLAILDTTARGAQPSVAADGSSAFIHNGEIYNFRDLRRELEGAGERFLSEGDAEVAHRILRRDGRAGLERLDGMFALAPWEERPGRLLLARDRIGIKPLYYALLPRGIAFASQPSAPFSGCPGWPRVSIPTPCPTSSPTATCLSTGASLRVSASSRRRTRSITKSRPAAWRSLRSGGWSADPFETTRKSCGRGWTVPSRLTWSPTFRWAPSCRGGSTRPSWRRALVRRSVFRRSRWPTATAIWTICISRVDRWSHTGVATTDVAFVASVLPTLLGLRHLIGAMAAHDLREDRRVHTATHADRRQRSRSRPGADVQPYPGRSVPTGARGSFTIAMRMSM